MALKTQVLAAATAFRLKLLVILLVIPVSAFVTAKALQRAQEQGFREVVRARFLFLGKTTAEGRAARADLHVACGDARFRSLNPEPCRFSDMIRTAAIMSAASAALALVLFIGITVAGRMKYEDRDHLLRVFVPGFKITGYATACLVLIYAALLTGVVYVAESHFLGFVHLYLLWGLLLGGLGAAVSSWSAVRSMLEPPPVHYYYAKIAAADDAPALWRLISDAASKVDAALPEHVVLGVDANFFVTEDSIRTMDGPLRGRILFLSLPLCRLMKTDELEAVLAHELSHFSGRDTEYGLKYLPIYRGAMTSHFEMKSGTFAAIPVQLLMRYFLESFATATATIGRERELRADSAGARAVSPRALASALAKLHIYGPLLHPVRRELRDAVFEEKPIPDPNALLARRVAERASSRSTEGLEERNFPHPTDTHPRLKERMRNLLLEIDDVADEAFGVPPPVSALSTMPRGDELEKAIWKTLAEQAINDFAKFQTPR